MSVVKIVKTIKEVHKESIAMVKIGSFYHVYGRDAYIMSYLFKYRLKQIEKDYVTCGFPASTINKVQATLEENKIDYLILSRRNNYEVDEKVEHKKQNKYKQMYEKARIYVNVKSRIDTIYNYLEESIFDKDVKDLISNIEKLIDERRKI